LQHINPSTSPNELNTTLTPHSIIHGDACFAYFNKIWGIPPVPGHRLIVPLICILLRIEFCMHPVIPANKQNKANNSSDLGTEVFAKRSGAVAGVVGIEVGVVSGVFHLESSGVDAPDWRPRHEEH
jgi:hypothetical protein